MCDFDVSDRYLDGRQRRLAKLLRYELETGMKKLHKPKKHPEKNSPKILLPERNHV